MAIRIGRIILDIPTIPAINVTAIMCGIHTGGIPGITPISGRIMIRSTAAAITRLTTIRIITAAAAAAPTAVFRNINAIGIAVHRRRGDRESIERAAALPVAAVGERGSAAVKRSNGRRLLSTAMAKAAFRAVPSARIARNVSAK